MESKKTKKIRKIKNICPFRVLISERGDVSQIQIRAREETLLKLPFVKIPALESNKKPSTQSSSVNRNDKIIPNSLSESQIQNLQKLQNISWASPKQKPVLPTQTPDSGSKTLSRKATFSSAKILELSPKVCRKQTRFEILNMETELNTQIFSWAIKLTQGELPHSCEYSQMCTINQTLYLCGGFTNPGNFEVKSLNLTKDTWKLLKLSKKFPGLIGFSVTSFKSKLLIYGGYHLTSHNLRHYSKKVFIVSSKSGKIKSHKGYGYVPRARRNHMACQLERFLIVFAGIVENNFLVNEFLCFNTLTYNWDKIDSGKAPSPRSHGTLTAIYAEKSCFKNELERLNHVVARVNMKNGGFYCFGGIDELGKCLDELWCMHLQNDRFVWVKVEARGVSPKARFGHSAVGHLNKIFVFGGRNYCDGFDVALNDLNVFDVGLVMWEQIHINSEAPEVRWGHSMSIYNSQILVFGGINHKGMLSNNLYYLNS